MCRYKNKNNCIKLMSIIIALIIHAVGLAVLFSSCNILEGGKDFLFERFSNEKQMEEAVEAVDIFFELLMKKDYSGAYKYISSENKKNWDKQEFIREFSDVTDIISVEINKIEIKNNIAIVSIDLIDSYDGEKKMYKDIEVSLIKEEDESWKIVFWK